MNISVKLDHWHNEAKQNVWLHYFAVFNRLVLALGFIPAGFVKITDERFASGLSVLHPMGHYLEALHFTGFYYTFIGIVQILAAILLLIPRTVTLGALLYFPIILNIMILSYAVRFDGSLLTAPLMTLANLYLLCWNYDKIKHIFPFENKTVPEKPKKLSKTFPKRFFSAVALSIFSVWAGIVFMHNFLLMPRNTLQDCGKQFAGESREKEGKEFCECIHIQGRPLNDCLEQYEKAIIQADK